MYIVTFINIGENCESLVLFTISLRKIFFTHRGYIRRHTRKNYDKYCMYETRRKRVFKYIETILFSI